MCIFLYAINSVCVLFCARNIYLAAAYGLTPCNMRRSVSISYSGMFDLKCEKPVFYRVKRGQTAEDISREFACPVGEVYEGQIIKLPQGGFTEYRARAGDSFASVARTFGVDAGELERLNGGYVYPTRRLLIPLGGQKQEGR